jgi:hypothetical protein
LILVEVDLTWQQRDLYIQPIQKSLQQLPILMDFLRKVDSIPGPVQETPSGILVLAWDILILKFMRYSKKSYTNCNSPQRYPPT